jgi:group I intron endonuclease
MSVRQSGIYRITQEDTGRVYVGSSIDIENRWKQHVNQLKRGIHVNKKMQVDASEYGIESFQFDILELVETDNILLDKRERFWQDTAGAKQGYNAKEFPRRGASVNHSYVHSIYISSKLWKDVKRAANGLRMSIIISMLLQMWLDGEIKITVGRGT